jgi:hypothetical protein
VNNGTWHVLIGDSTRGKGKNDGRRSDGARQLGDAVEYEPHRPDGADEKQCKADIRVEEPACGAKEEPGGYQQAQAKGSRNVERSLEMRALHFVRALRPAKSEQEKHRRPHKLEDGGLQIGRKIGSWPVMSEMHGEIMEWIKLKQDNRGHAFADF